MTQTTPVLITATLTNGKVVGNFSSPHAFTFEDDTVLEAVPADEALILSVNVVEKELPGGKGDILLDFALNAYVLDRMNMWSTAYKKGLVDVVLCPLMMITAMKQLYDTNDLVEMPFRSIRMTDRINKKVSISKQCI